MISGISFARRSIDSIVDHLNIVAVSEGLAAISGAIHQRNDLTVWMVEVGTQIVVAPGPGAPDDSNPVFSSWQNTIPFAHVSPSTPAQN